MQIALGVAKGLEYLHNVTKPPVIHSNLTTGHILLDHDFKPKITGFGLAKSGPIADIGTSVVGTKGYWAPEYVNSGELTLKSDIYSFGVVMLELITGREPIGDSSLGPQHMLVERVMPWIILLFGDSSTWQHFNSFSSFDRHFHCSRTTTWGRF